MQIFWLAYPIAAVAASALFAAAGWRSRHMSGVPPIRVNGVEELSYPQPDAVGPELQPMGDVAEAIHIALKRLAPVIVGNAAQLEVAAPVGLLVRMRGPILADLLEELLASALHSAPASRLLLTAVCHGDRIYICLSDDVPGADVSVRQSALRGVAARVALRGGALDVRVLPDEGTTMTLRVAAAFEKPADAEIEDDHPVFMPEWGVRAVPVRLG